MAPSSDGLLSSILNDDDLQLMDPAAMGADGKIAAERRLWFSWYSTSVYRLENHGTH